MKRLVLIVVGLAVLGVVWLALRAHNAQKPADGAGAANAADRVVPVRTAPVAVADVPIFLEGLGNATGFYTVIVRTQVDGRLDSVGFREAQAVKKGDLLAQVDPRPFEIQEHQAQAALAKDTAALHDAELTLARDKELLSKQLIAQSQVDDQTALVQQARAGTQADQAQIESAELNLKYARITSPIDGVTGVRQVDPGNVVHPADANGIVVVTQLDPISVIFTLPQDDLPQVSKAMSEGTLQVEAYSRDGSQLLGKGALELVDNQINAATATLRLKAKLDNPDHLLWPNQFVKVRLRLAVQQGAHTMPAVAIQNGPQGAFVYVVQPDNTVATAPVKVALLQGETAILTDGPAPGSLVVTDGQNQLRPGAKVSTGAGNGGAGGAGNGAAPSGHGGRDGGHGSRAEHASVDP